MNLFFFKFIIFYTQPKFNKASRLRLRAYSMESPPNPLESYLYTLAEESAVNSISPQTAHINSETAPRAEHSISTTLQPSFMRYSTIFLVSL